jgi:autotransporter translocation and assembly factor TamB
VEVGGADAFVFQDFRLDHVDLALSTVRRLIPAILLQGRLTGTGVLEGPWLEASYDGALRHADLPLPASDAAGTFRVDATGPIVGLWASLAFDSLRLDGLASTFPEMPMIGAFAGDVRVGGYLDSLVLDADVAGDAGELRVRGPLFFAEDSLGAHRVHVTTVGFDLSALREGAPVTTIDGAARLAGWWRDAAAFGLGAVMDFGPSLLEGAPVDSLHAALRWEGDALAFDSLRIDGFRWTLDATGLLGREATTESRLQFVARSDSIGVLEPWVAAILGPPAGADTAAPSGTARVAGTVTGSPSAPGVIADIALDGVRRGDLRITGARGSAAYAGESRILNAQLQVDSASWDRVRVSAMTVRAHGRPDSLGWSGATQVWESGTVAGEGRWQQRADAMLVAIDSVTADLTHGAWRIDDAVAIWSDDGLTLEGFDARNDSGVGRITAAGRLPFRGPGDFTASVESAALADLWLLLGRDPSTVTGSLGGTFRLQGTARAPVIEAMVGIRNATVGQSTIPQVTGSLRYDAQRLTGTMEARRMGEPVLTVDVGLPVDLAIVGAERRRLPGRLSLRARADSVDLGLVNTITPQVRRAAGSFGADVGLAGTWEDPQLTGTVTVRDGVAEFPAIGVRHEQLNGQLRLAGDTIHVQALNVRSGRGTAAVAGYVRLEELSRPLVNLRVHAEDFRIVDMRDFLTLAASGDVGITGPAVGATLRGRASVTRGVLYFADLLTKDVVDLDNPLFRDFVDTTQLREEGLATAFEVRLLDSLRIDSLQLEMSRETWLRSREANIQLAGSLTVDRAGDEFLLNGTLETPRGSYRLELMPAFTREFTVTGGQVRYFGTRDLNAGLDIDAQHVVRPRRGEPVTVSVHIGGTVYEPDLQLASDVSPPLSDTEIISYLLFGAPSVQSRQDWLTAQSVAEELFGTVTGQLGTMLISDWGVPLDYAQIRPASSGEGLGVEGDFGKQFTVFGRPAFLTATPLLCSRQTTQFDIGASLEYQLSRRWLVAASIDPARRCRSFATETTLRYQFGLDVFWEIAY